jgi:hypothetical protein
MNPAHFEAFMFAVVIAGGLVAVAVLVLILQEIGLWDWTPEDELHTRLWILEQERRHRRGHH